MDTSEQYIKMCEKVEEIQGCWNAESAKAGDFFYHIQGKDVQTVSGEILGDGDLSCACCNRIWLPRQDQLQEMVSKRLKEIRMKIDWYFGDQWRMIFYDDPLKYSHVYGKSMEQLWLAFVMREKFNKIWNVGDWVKEEKGE